MSRLVCFSTLLSGLLLLTGCGNLATPRDVLWSAPVVQVYELPGIQVNAVAGTDYFNTLQIAIDHQDWSRMLTAGFTPEQAATLLDPAQSADFLAPYREAARGRHVAVMDGQLCRVWINAGVYRLKPQRPAEACAKL